MATTSKTSTDGLDAGLHQLNDLGERVVSAARQATLVGLDAYDKAVDAVADLQLRAAAATQLEWVNTAVKAQTALLKEVAGVYSTTARQLVG